MIWFIIYLIGCIIACCTIVRFHLKESDLRVKDVPVIAIYTIISWITIASICIYCIHEYMCININGDKVIFKKKG